MILSSDPFSARAGIASSYSLLLLAMWKLTAACRAMVEVKMYPTAKMKDI